MLDLGFRLLEGRLDALVMKPLPPAGIAKLFGAGSSGGDELLKIGSGHLAVSELEHHYRVVNPPLILLVEEMPILPAPAIASRLKLIR